MAKQLGLWLNVYCCLGLAAGITELNCKDGSRVLDLKRLCDGKVDCADGSDENTCGGGGFYGCVKKNPAAKGELPGIVDCGRCVCPAAFVAGHRTHTAMKFCLVSESKIGNGRVECANFADESDDIRDFLAITGDHRSTRLLLFRGTWHRTERGGGDPADVFLHAFPSYSSLSDLYGERHDRTGCNLKKDLFPANFQFWYCQEEELCVRHGYACPLSNEEHHIQSVQQQGSQKGYRQCSYGVDLEVGCGIVCPGRGQTCEGLNDTTSGRYYCPEEGRFVASYRMCGEGRCHRDYLHCDPHGIDPEPCKLRSDFKRCPSDDSCVGILHDCPACSDRQWSCLDPETQVATCIDLGQGCNGGCHPSRLDNCVLPDDTQSRSNNGGGLNVAAVVAVFFGGTLLGLCAAGIAYLTIKAKRRGRRLRAIYNLVFLRFKNDSVEKEDDVQMHQQQPKNGKEIEEQNMARYYTSATKDDRNSYDFPDQDDSTTNNGGDCTPYESNI